MVHDRGRVLADLACAIADGARVISDFRVMRDQAELFGLVAPVPTTWRTLKEIARAGGRADKRMTVAVNAARRHAWAQVTARHGALPGVRLADRRRRCLAAGLGGMVVRRRRSGLIWGGRVAPRRW